jgi:hypothetical protein
LLRRWRCAPAPLWATLRLPRARWRQPGASTERYPGATWHRQAFGYGESQLRFHSGDALTRLGDTVGARQELHRALELCAPGDYTDRSMVLLDLAACMIADGHCAAGTEQAVQVLLGLDGPRRQGIINDRGRELLGSLPRAVRALPAARDLHELLNDTTGMKEIGAS